MSNSNPLDKPKNIRAESVLAACLRGGRLSHAILVEGMNGTLDFAKRIAAAQVCDAGSDAPSAEISSAEIKPCGICAQCVKAEKGIHPDIIVFSGGDRARSFHVDSVRELRREAYIRPNDASAKVLILENVQNMTVQAQNALLKIIEEPPGAVSFILTCENKSVLLETVLSRVSVFSLDDTDSPPEDSECEQTGFGELAAGIINNLISGSELDALAAFSAYEKDRTGLGQLLAEIRAESASQLAAIALSGQNDRNKSKKLMLLIDVADELEAGLNQNAGGLLMSVIFPAKFKRLYS